MKEMKSAKDMNQLKKTLKENGIKWYWNNWGLLHIYRRVTHPQKMSDHSYWNGCETIGNYRTWDEAVSCENLKDYLINER